MTCEDQSDKIYRVNTFCNPRKYLQIYSDVWCSEDRDPKVVARCTGLHQWFSSYENTTHTDPHGCQASCSRPGPGCEACTNMETHFICEESGACVHRDLVCDGHPQCEYGEDEDLELCKQRWLQTGVVEPYASFTCQSLMYPGMKTVVTACNGIVECYDGSDEGSCSDTLTIYFLITTIIGVIFLYLFLKYLHSNKKAKIKIDPDEGRDNFELENLYVTKEDPDFFDFVTHHEDQHTIQRANILLLNVIFSETRDAIKEKSICFFDLVSKTKKDNDSEIFSYLHNNFDPVIAKEIFSAKFPGLTEKITDGVETLFHWKFITQFKDMTTKNHNLDEMVSTLNTIRKILSNSLDLFKDSYLAIYLLVIIGGPMAIIEFISNFTSVIILSLIATIFVPIIASSAYIALKSPNLVFSFIEEITMMNLKKRTAAVACVVCGPLIPVFVIHSLSTTLQDAKRFSKQGGENAVVLFQKVRKISSLLASTFRIELGN